MANSAMNDNWDGPVLEDFGSEEKVVFYRSSMAEIPLIVVIFIVTTVSLYLDHRFPVLSSSSNFLGYRVELPLMILFPVALMSWLVHRLYDQRYEIGKDYIRGIFGLLSLRKKDIRIEFADIRGIEVDRGIIGRVLNTGDLRIGSAMHENIELSIAGIRDPSLYRDILRFRRKLVYSSHTIE